MTSPDSAAPERTPAEAVLERHLRRLHKLSEDVPFASLPEPQKSYVAYAMSTVERGRGSLEELVSHGLRPGFRFLDAGCAYGGYLAAAAERGAGEVIGIELESKYLDIARDLLAALAVPGRLIQGSLSDPAVTADLGLFDVVTCADVIEHVDHVPRTMANLCRLVAPGGLFYLAVPNAWAPRCVRVDPHFQVFGITLLEPPLAKDYYFRISGAKTYGVGEYHHLDDYRRWMRDGGLEVSVINGPMYPDIALQEIAAETDRMVEEGERFADDRLPAATVARVKAETRRLAAQIRTEMAAPGGRAGWRFWRRHPDTLEIALQYWIPTWHLLGRRPPAA